MSTPNLIDAVRAAKENERIAAEKYTAAAQEIVSPVGKYLFEQLSEFEKFHYVKLASLEQSLEEKNKFTHYEGKMIPLPPVFEVKAAEEPNQKTVITIIAQAIELEKEAERTYAEMAAQVTDPQGHAMFDQLSKEEYDHYCLLREAYWTINNLGTWKYHRP